MATTSTQAQKIPQPKLKTSLSNPLIYPESSQINQSPTSYHSQLPSPSNNHNKTKSNTFSSIFSNSGSNKFFKRRYEIYEENDEFTNGCFGFSRTLGSKIKYKIKNAFVKFQWRLHKKNSSDGWKSKVKTL